MIKRIQRSFLSVAALAALSLGGAAIASAQNGAKHAHPVRHAGARHGHRISHAVAEADEQPGSESAANSDGPGGHADEPGNATADHQFQGQE
jgi:hypothetical protein